MPSSGRFLFLFSTRPSLRGLASTDQSCYSQHKPSPRARACAAKSRRAASGGPHRRREDTEPSAPAAVRRRRARFGGWLSGTVSAFWPPGLRAVAARRSKALSSSAPPCQISPHAPARPGSACRNDAGMVGGCGEHASGTAAHSQGRSRLSREGRGLGRVAPAQPIRPPTGGRAKGRARAWSQNVPVVAVLNVLYDPLTRCRPAAPLRGAAPVERWGSVYSGHTTTALGAWRYQRAIPTLLHWLLCCRTGCCCT